MSAPLQPVQIISVDLDSNEVKANRANLELIQANLRDAGVEKVSVVSVMGAYRTGKSFLLDLFLRYLESEEGGGIKSNFEGGLDGAAAAAEYRAAQDGVDERSKGSDYALPDWMKKGGSFNHDLRHVKILSQSM